MKIIELNRPAVRPPISITGLSIKPYVSHMQYMTKSRIIQMASLEKPVYRLSKDYTKDGVKFGISLLTDKKDMAKAEKFMDDTAEELTREEVVQYIRRPAPFTYLNKEYKARK